jgi:hypothetical protein
MLNFVLWLTLLLSSMFGTFGPTPYPTCGGHTCGTGARR